LKEQAMSNNNALHAMRNTIATALLLCCAHAMAAIPIQHWTQPSGAKVYLVESPTIPMVDVQIDFDAGSRRDPADKAGLAGVTAGMTSKGITAARAPGSGAYDAAMDENQVGEAWADLGAGFGASAGSDRMSFSLRTLNYPDLLRTRSGSASGSASPPRSAKRIPNPAPWPAMRMPPRSTAATPTGTKRPRRRWPGSRSTTCARPIAGGSSLAAPRSASWGP
jgi:hypothetical protein